jgi:glycolate oxidase iron-sulfur subunit
VDIGRKLVEQQVERPASQRFMRTLLRETLTRRWLFDPAMRVGQAVRPLLPEALKAKVPERRDPGKRPSRSHARKVILLEGCVQPGMLPSIDAATDRVLDRLGLEAVRPQGSGCCGAIRHHLNDQAGAANDARRNIAAWWPLIEAGAEAILINASGCGAMVKDYAHLLADDPEWAARAKQVVERTRDLAEWLPAEIDAAIAAGRLRAASSSRVVFHPPCTLQHGQKVRGVVEGLLTRLGATVLPVGESHLCCGSAGTYSVLQPQLSGELRSRKLGHLTAGEPELILSANIGCITHLQAGTGTPVRHWIEWLDEQMGAVGG